MWRRVWQAVSNNRIQLKAVQVSDSQNEKTRQKAGFSGVSEILKAFSGTLYGAGTRSRTRDLLITSQLLYQLSYTGVLGDDYSDWNGSVNP